MATRKIMSVTPREQQLIDRQQALADALMKQNGIPDEWRGQRVTPQYGIGHGLTALASALAGGYIGRKANERQTELDDQTRAQNEGVINDLTMDQRPQKIASDMRPIPGTEPQQMLDINTGRPELSQQGKALQMALSGMDPQSVQQALAQQQVSRLLPQQERTVLPYGSQYIDQSGKVLASNDRLPAGVGGGSSADMQLFRYIKASNPNATPQQIMDEARAFKETFSNAERAGVGGVVGNRSGAFVPQTDIGTVASNLGSVERSKGAGSEAGKTETQKFFDMPQAHKAVLDQDARTDLFVRKVNELVNNPGLSRSTGLWSYFPSIRGGNAANAEAAIATLGSQIGLNSLQEMRSNSKTGGALGNVSDKDLELLQSELVSLSKAQSEEQFVQGLTRIAGYMQESKQRRQAAFQADYGNARNPNGDIVTPGGSGTEFPDQSQSKDIASLPKVNSKGWRLMRDAQTGTRAYMSPDGTQFEEVR